MANDDVWIEIETSRGGGGETYIFAGQVDAGDFRALVLGKLATPFLRLTRVFWYKYDNDEEKWKASTRTLYRYGEGEYMNYTGDMFFHKDTIINISVLRYGPDEIPDGI